MRKPRTLHILVTHFNMNTLNLIEHFADDEEEEFIQLLQQQQQLLADFTETTDNKPVHGGSQPGRSPNINRNSLEGHKRIINDYFADQPIYGERLFRRRFRM